MLLQVSSILLIQIFITLNNAIWGEYKATGSVLWLKMENPKTGIDRGGKLLGLWFFVEVQYDIFKIVSPKNISRGLPPKLISDLSNPEIN